MTLMLEYSGGPFGRGSPTMAHAAKCLLTCVCCLVIGQQAAAARVIHAEIHLLGGRVVLRALTGDDGRAGEDAVWDYLKRVSFGGGAKVSIRPDPDNPLRATLEGKIKVRIAYGGEVEVSTLRLIRAHKIDDEWKIDPKQVDEMAKVKRKP